MAFNETDNLDGIETSTEREFPAIEWTEDHENILVDWADKAMCYRWLHSRANQTFSRKNAWYTIPVIIMSTVTGTANFAQERFPPPYKEYAPMMIGAVNIFAGILTTIQQFLKITELNEAHRVAAISWDKFYRNIKVELAKDPRERIDVTHMLKQSKEEFDRLMETSPVISKEVVHKFKSTFERSKDKAVAFSELKKPEICDSLETTQHAVFKAKDIEKKGPSTTMVDLIKKKREEARKAEIITDFINKFRNEYSREPTVDEVYENLREVVAEELVQKIMNKTIVPSEQETILNEKPSLKNLAAGVMLTKKLGENLETSPV